MFIKIPKLDSNAKLAQWLCSQKPGVKFSGSIFDLNSGEIYLDQGKLFGKYEKYSIPKLLLDEKIFIRERSSVRDPREEEIYFITSFKRYYTVVNKGQGQYSVLRTDLKPFKQFDLSNIIDIFIPHLEWNAETGDNQYLYDHTPEDLRIGLKKYLVKPISLNYTYVLNNFTDFYVVKTRELRFWFEEGVDFSDYDGDCEIPIEITKMNKEKFIEEDLDVIRKWMCYQNKHDLLGGVNIGLSTNQGCFFLNEENITISFKR